MISNLLALIEMDLKANGCKNIGIFGFLYSFFFNPGFIVVVRARIAIWSYDKNAFGRILSKVLWMRNVKQFGCYISPAAMLGSSLRLPHPIGVVIGGGVLVESNVTLYQGVTLGRMRPDEPKVPIVRKNTVIYANALVVGDVMVQENSFVVANSLTMPERENHGE